MIRKIALFLCCLAITIPGIAQNYTASKTRKLLTTHEWKLKYVLDGDKKEEPPEGMKGLHLVFMPSKDMIYEYMPGKNDIVYIRKGVIEAEHFKYEDRIEEPEMVLKMDELEEGLLAFSDEFDEDNKYYVYEKGDPIKSKGYPPVKYEIQDVDVPMQRVSPELTELTKSINAELKKSSGHLFFYDKNKARYHIKDARFEATEYGVKFSMVYDTKDSKNRSYSYEFLPERIDEITEVKVDPESRVGQLKLTLENESCVYNSSDAVTSMIKVVYIDYFKETWDPLESTCRHASLSIL